MAPSAATDAGVLPLVVAAAERVAPSVTTARPKAPRDVHKRALLLTTDESAATAFETAEGIVLSVATATCPTTILAAARAMVDLGRAASCVLTVARAASVAIIVVLHSLFLCQWTQK